jgi:hypothetical protein
MKVKLPTERRVKKCYIQKLIENKNGILKLTFHPYNRIQEWTTVENQIDLLNMKQIISLN